MQTFNIHNIDYEVLYEVERRNTKYSLALTFWHSNFNDMIFTLEYINKTWSERALIDISICSYADIPEDLLPRIKPLVDVIVKAKQDMGKQDGTTCHALGAMYPLMQRTNIQSVMHTDVDVVPINQVYFFGLSNILLDSGKVLLSSQDTIMYNMEKMKRSVYTQHDIDQTRQFGSTFIINRKRALETDYWPFPMHGHWEKDRYTHFINCGLSVEKDAIIIPRFPIDNDIPSNFLYSFDLNLGVVHNSTSIEFPETEDRKIRLLKLMGQERWEGIQLGWKWNYNPKSPRPNYKMVEPPPQPKEE